MRRLVLLFVTALAFAACGPAPDTATAHSTELQSLQCPPGQIPWNFTQFPQAMTSESMRQSGSGDVPADMQLPTPVTLNVSIGACAGEETLTAEAGEACNGHTSCSFTAPACPGTVQIRYTCSDHPDQVLGQRCDSAKGCYFTLSCPQPQVSPAQVDAHVACVPEQCHGATRRDSELQCVTDTSRPVEYRNGYGTERMQVIQPLLEADPVYPQSQYAWNEALSQKSLDFDPTGIPGLDGPSPSFIHLRPGAALGIYRVLFSESLYDMEYRVRYVVPSGEKNKGLQGVLTLWAYDEWARSGQVEEKTYRCELHSVDMRKYGPGTPVGGNVYEIAVKERFLIPRDCLGDSGSGVESQAAAGRRRGQTLTEFLNAFTHQGTFAAASYGLDNEVILLDDPSDPAKKSTCAPNPSDFFYDQTAQAVDRYKYLDQRRIPFTFVRMMSPYSGYEPQRTDQVWFRETTQTNLGVSAIRPKTLVQKIRTVGPARGYLRADIDWYLSGDRHKYWQTHGLTSDQEDSTAYLEGFLIPLDANDRPVAAGIDGYPSIGRLRISRSSANGVTYSANYPITETLRQQFMDPTSPLTSNREGRKYLMRACVRFGGADPFGTRTANHGVYNLQILDRCQDSATPVVIRLDPSVAPLEPMSSDPFSEANPAAAGDNHLSQNFDNDMETDCVPGTRECRTVVSNGLEGYGAFGGSIFSSELTTTTAADGSAAATAHKEVSIFGFTVMDEEDPQEAVSVAGTKSVTFSIEPPWDDIAEGMRKVSPPSVRWNEKSVVGQKGLGVGWGYTTPVHFGPVQGDVEIAFTIGFGLSLNFTYEFGGDTPAGCTGTDDDCQSLYVLQPAMPLRDAINQCYGKGGRLADMVSDTETGFLAAKVPAGDRVWLFGQVANEYANPQCLQTWSSTQCATGHQTYLRWLSNDEDFATSTSFGHFAVDPSAIAFGETAGTIHDIGVQKPSDQGVTLASDGTLAVEPMSASHPSVCRFRNTASATKHTLSGNAELTFGAGIGGSFCTPSSKFGVCLEASLNILGARLTPELKYTHFDLVDALGRKGRQSNLTFNLNLELVLLSGEINAKVVFGPWFSFKYNLLTFSGVSLPAGGDLYTREWPMYEELK